MLLDRSEITRLLFSLSERLNRLGLLAELYVVGGAAIALAYDVRRTTCDIDAVFEPKSIIYKAAAEIAKEYGLEVDWLNDAVKGFLPANANLIFEAPGIRVLTASPEYLLAMKVAAARVGRDSDDIKFLAAFLGIRDAAGVLKVVEQVWGGNGRLLPKARFLVEEIMSEQESNDGAV